MSQVAKYFDQAVAFKNGRYPRDTFITLVGGTPLPEEEDRRPGRPEIGGQVHTCLGDLLLGRVDAYAAARRMSRAKVIRDLIEAGLATAGQDR